MMITRKEVRDACDKIAPKYGFDPDLIFAVCLIEGEQEKDGSFNPSVARLEQGYYRKYVEPQELATTTEILLSASYGVLQVMAQSLKEAGFFDWFFEIASPRLRNIIKSPLSMLAVVYALNEFCVNLEWQIDWGCRWMKVKEKLAGGNIERMLSFWNGDLSGLYANKVLQKYSKVKK